MDTESIEFESIREVWAAHGATYTMGHFEGYVGSATGPDWVSELIQLTGLSLHAGDLSQQRREVRVEMLDALRPRDGILGLVTAASEAGIGLAIASNSPISWIQERLDRVGLLQHMSVLIGVDTASQPKPHPAPYLEACLALGVQPKRAVALEDSVLGVRSATQAGLYTVACPGPLTRNHDLSAANRQVISLGELSLADLGRALDA